MLLFGLGGEYFEAVQVAEANLYFAKVVQVDPNYAAV
jgi:hypothetical protein